MSEKISFCIVIMLKFMLFCGKVHICEQQQITKIREDVMRHTVTLDKTDLKILQVLQENGRLSNVELSERVALSPSPCLRRLKQLEDSGIIRGYAALLEPQAVELGLQVMIRVSTDKHPDARSGFEEAIEGWNEVLACLALTGEADYLLHAFFTDMNAFSHFVLNQLLSHSAVQDVKSSFVLKEIKNTTALPLQHLS